MGLGINLIDPTTTYMTQYLYEANITHNLGEMAQAAKIYEALWRPHRLIDGYDIPKDDHEAEWAYEDSVTIRAKDIIDILEKGLTDLKGRPKYYARYNSPNGWGMYDNFVPFVEKYLEACKEYPEAIVEVDR